MERALTLPTVPVDQNLTRAAGPELLDPRLFTSVAGGAKDFEEPMPMNPSIQDFED